MGAGSVAAGIEVPPEFVGLHTAAVDFGHEFVVGLLTDGAADDLANLGEEDVGALHGGSGRLDAAVTGASGGGTARHTGGGILFHVEGLDGGGVVGHDDGLLEMLLDEVALVLGGEVVAPVAGELELMAVLDGFL